MEKVTELFGSMVFNEEVMKQRLSTTCYKAWRPPTRWRRR